MSIIKLFVKFSNLGTGSLCFSDSYIIMSNSAPKNNKGPRGGVKLVFVTNMA